MKLVENIVEYEITVSLKNMVEECKDKEGNLIMILHGIQKECGYIPANTVDYVSEILGIEPSKIYGVITFYNYFSLEPPATNTLSVCMGTACYLKGAADILEAFRKEMKIKPNTAYSDDGKYKIEEVRCIGCCGLAPVITFNKEVIGRVKVEDVASIVASKSK